MDCEETREAFQAGDTLGYQEAFRHMEDCEACWDWWHVSLVQPTMEALRTRSKFTEDQKEWAIQIVEQLLDAVHLHHRDSSGDHEAVACERLKEFTLAEEGQFSPGEMAAAVEHFGSCPACDAYAGECVEAIRGLFRRVVTSDGDGTVSEKERTLAILRKLQSLGVGAEESDKK